MERDTPQRSAHGSRGRSRKRDALIERGVTPRLRRRGPRRVRRRRRRERSSSWGLLKVAGAALHDVDVGREAIVQPTADEVARGTAAMDNLVVASSAAKVARPATPAGFLPVDMAVGEPGDALASVQPALHVAQMASRVL